MFGRTAASLEKTSFQCRYMDLNYSLNIHCDLMTFDKFIALDEVTHEGHSSNEHHLVIFRGPAVVGLALESVSVQVLVA